MLWWEPGASLTAARNATGASPHSSAAVARHLPRMRHRRDDIVVAAAEYLLVPLEQLDHPGARTAVVATVGEPLADAPDESW